MNVYNLHISGEEDYSYEDQVFRNPVTSGEQIRIEGEYYIVDAVTHDVDSGQSWLYLQPIDDSTLLT